MHLFVVSWVVSCASLLCGGFAVVCSACLCSFPAALCFASLCSLCNHYIAIFMVIFHLFVVVLSLCDHSVPLRSYLCHVLLLILCLFVVVFGFNFPNYIYLVQTAQYFSVFSFYPFYYYFSCPINMKVHFRDISWLAAFYISHQHLPFPGDWRKYRTNSLQLWKLESYLHSKISVKSPFILQTLCAVKDLNFYSKDNWDSPAGYYKKYCITPHGLMINVRVEIYILEF